MYNKKRMFYISSIISSMKKLIIFHIKRPSNRFSRKVLCWRCNYYYFSRRSENTPKLRIFTWTCMLTAPVLHLMADLHLPTIKKWLYLCFLVKWNYITFYWVHPQIPYPVTKNPLFDIFLPLIICLLIDLLTSFESRIKEGIF